MRFFIIFIIFTAALNASESLSKLGFTDFEPKAVFKHIDKYKEDATEQLKKLKGKDKEERAESMKYFLDLPSAPSELLVQALLNEKDKETRANLKKIIMSAVNKPTYEDWTQLALAALTEKLSKSDTPTKHLLEIVKRNKSPKLIPSLETAFAKNSDKEGLLKIYKESKDDTKIILYEAVSEKLNKADVDKALASKSEPFRFKVAKEQLNKGNEKALEVIVDSLTSENKELAKESSQIVNSTKDVKFDATIKSLINRLGAESFEEKDKAKKTLIALPSSLSQKIETIGLEIYKLSDDSEIKIGFLDIIKVKIADLGKQAGYIGVHLSEDRSNDIKKVMINKTVPNTPAAKAGVPDNCQILKLNKENFEKSDLVTFRAHLQTLTAGTPIELTLKTSKGETIVKKLTLTTKPNTSTYMLFQQWKARNLGTSTSIR